MIKERWMRPAVMEWCNRHGYTPCCEVWVGNGLADVVAIKFHERVGRKPPEMKFLLAVELKLSDISDVLRQAEGNQRYCHFSFAAMPATFVSRMLPKTLKRFSDGGIGLLAVHEGGLVEVAVAAACSDRPSALDWRDKRMTANLWRRIRSGRTHVTPEETAKAAAYRKELQALGYL